MTLSQASKSLTAPLDAALPYTTAAALSLAIGSFAPHPDPSRKVSPRAIVRSRRLITDCGSQNSESTADKVRGIKVVVQ
jgi:hypothetical protein